ncbi:MAG: LuxR family transcriptional regulator [Actinobacteria bacterium]|nr:LuxR family transcriptional regulator [Actinomycetota bacterium]
MTTELPDLPHSMITTDALPTGVVTFLLSDVEGSTQLWQAGEDNAARAIARHYELLGAAVALHGGARPVEQGEGDSVVGAFSMASDALAAALDVQRAFAAEEWPGDVDLKVRIGLHTGEAHLRDEHNYFGNTIIRSARLRAIAHGGQTVLSRATADVVSGHPPDGVTLRDLGEHYLKDLGDPERVYQLCHPDLPDEFPPLRSLNRHVHNLPGQLTTLVGRERELRELHAAIDGARLLTLTGAGGCGKTRLALQLAADVAERHADGTWWIELAPVSAPDLVAAAVAAALGFREEEGKLLVDTLAEQLADVTTLLVLDNCEQVLDATARLVDELLRRVPGLRVIATSREPLGIPGETTWRVPSLDDTAAFDLFIDRANHARPGFAPGDDERSAVVRICDRLDGIPLAIELAAARVRMMHPARIAAALDEGFRVLTGGARTVMPRQQTLEACIGWSHDLLNDEERALFRRLAVFAGGFTLEAAEAATAGDDIEVYAVLDAVSRLVDKSLIHVDHGGGGGRYRLLDTIRLFARDRLADAGESDAVRQRHLDFFVALAEAAEPALVDADGPARLAVLEREHDNIRAALEWADATGAQASLLRLTAALTIFWEVRGHLAAGGRWFARALARDPEERSARRARALWGAAHIALYSNDFATTLERAPAAFAMAEEVGDTKAMARALNTLGYLQLWSDPDAGRAALEQSVELGRGIGDNWSVADGLKMLTVTWLVQEDDDNLIPAIDDLRDAATALGNGFFLAWHHCCRAWVSLRRGALPDAREQVAAALEYCDAVGEPATAGIAVAALAEIDVLEGKYADADARLSAFLQRAAATGGEIGVPFAVIALGLSALGAGDPDQALATVAPLVEELRPLGLTLLVAWGLVVLAQAHTERGDGEAAATALDEARGLAASIANKWLIAAADFQRAELWLADGDIARAEDVHHAALRLRADGRWLPGVAHSLEALGRVAALMQSPHEAVRLLAAAAALRDAAGIAQGAAEGAAHERVMASIGEAHDGGVMDTAWSEGARLSVDEAVAYASRARGERKRPSSGWESLTPTEVQVVDLTAEGLTNPQIAERLFMARGTVKVHLAHVFTKLGVTTRSQLTAAATRRTLTQSR